MKDFWSVIIFFTYYQLLHDLSIRIFSHQDRRGSGVVTRRNRTTSTGLSGGAEEPTTHFASESVVSVKRRSLGAKVEACYDQLNQLLSEIITNQAGIFILFITINVTSL